MEYEIYTFGGGKILWMVFNGIGMLFQNESEYFTPVLKLSMAIGGLWAAIRAIYGKNFGIFARDWFVPAYLILSLMFVPKGSVLLIDEADPTFHFAKVDHVPAGLALVASTASKFSYALTNLIEEKFTPAEHDGLRYTKTGPMFAAHLLSMSRDVRIKDPVMRQNIKHFVKQCFMWPYVLTNIDPGTKAAKETDDILKFVEDNPHPALGIYWKGEDGQTEFKYCSACAPLVRQAMAIEMPRSIAHLISKLWDYGDDEQDETALSRKLSSYFDAGWQLIADEGGNAFDHVGQQMMINAYRESLDDQRESHGLSRLNPHLISHTATRGAEQQNAGFLVSGLMQAKYLPSLQAVFFALLVLLFVLVVPMTMLPGGFSLLGTWVKMIIWVQSWPIFFTILNSIGLMWLAKSGRAELLSNGGTLNLLTQNGIADAAWSSYCIVQGLFMMVPLLSWAVISKGGYALVSLAERMAPSIGQGLGAGIADNNQSFDTQAFHNRSMASYQMAQQQMSPTFNAGTTVDDGSQLQRTSVTGQQSVQQHLSNLGTNVAANENFSASLSNASEESYQAGLSSSSMASQSINETYQKGASLLESMAQGKTKVAGWSESENAALAQDASKALDLRKGFSESHTNDDSTQNNLSINAGFGGGVGKLLGGSLNFGVSDMRQGISSDGHKISNDLSNSIGQSSSERLTAAFDAARNNRIDSQDDHSKRVSDEYRGSYEKADRYSKDASARFDESRRLNEASQIASSAGISYAENLNDRLLNNLAQSRFGGDKGQAARWTQENPTSFKSYADQELSSRKQAMIDAVKTSSGPITEASLRSTFKAYESGLKNTASSASYDRVMNKGKEAGLGPDFKEDIQNHQAAQQVKIDGMLAERKNRIEQAPDIITSTSDELAQKKKELDEASLLERSTKGMFNVR
jgi:conjugal transfer mating pair stabilization protein TraG